MSMHRMRSVAALLLAGLLGVGCQNTSVPLSVEPQPIGGPELQAAEFGQVDIRVRWPQAPQAIPYSANSLHIAAFDGFGRLAAQAVLQKSPTQPLSSASMRLKAGAYTIEARAYRELSPTLQSEPTAFGSAGGVRVKSNLRTNLQLTLTATAPTFGPMSPTVGGAGSFFTIDTVEFFGRPAKQTDTVEVFFGQVPTTGTHMDYLVPAPVSFEPRRRLDLVTGNNPLVDPEEDMIRVTVPRGIKGECKVILSVDGVKVDIGTFHVVDRMAFTHSRVTREVGETVDAAQNLKAYALASQQPITYPAVVWRSTQPHIAFVTTGGMVYVYRPGTATIIAQSGDVSTTFTLVATDRHSTASVEVDVPELHSGTVEVPLEFPAYSGNENGKVTH